MINKDIIKAELTSAGLSFINIEAFGEVDSTNTLCASRIAEGVGEWHTIVASSQTGGRGRLGRSFFSPSGTGLYMSICLCPPPEKIGLITGAAAVCICEALEEFSLLPKIKWVNDIFIDGRKVCGILAKAAHTQKGASVILGIGVNVYCPEGGFPDDISGTAGYLFEKREEGKAERLAARIIEKLYKRYCNLGVDNAPEEYRKRCITVKRSVTVIPAGRPEDIKEAVAISVDDSYRLTVEYPDGKREVLSSGEVSVKI